MPPSRATGAGRNGDLHPHPQPHRRRAHPRAAPPPPDRFAWLRDQATSTNVFVPVLLGAGVVLSLLAHAVERLASATATPVLERRLATRLEPLALAPGGLLAPAPRPFDAAGPARMASGPRWANRAFCAVAVALAIFGTCQLIDLVADATQTRHDPVPTGRSVEVTYAVDTKGRVPDLSDTAEALWVACRGVLNRSVLATEPAAVGEGTVQDRRDARDRGARAPAAGGVPRGRHARPHDRFRRQRPRDPEPDGSCPRRRGRLERRGAQPLSRVQIRRGASSTRLTATTGAGGLSTSPPLSEAAKASCSSDGGPTLRLPRIAPTPSACPVSTR